MYHTSQNITGLPQPVSSDPMSEAGMGRGGDLKEESLTASVTVASLRPYRVSGLSQPYTSMASAYCILVNGCSRFTPTACTIGTLESRVSVFAHPSPLLDPSSHAQKTVRNGVLGLALQPAPSQKGFEILPRAPPGCLWWNRRQWEKGEDTRCQAIHGRHGTGMGQ